MKFPLLFLLFVTSLMLNGQTLKYYDSTGKLIVNEEYEINLDNIDCFLQIEKYIENEIASQIDYPEVAYENALKGIGIISINKSKNNISIRLEKGVGPFMDKEVLDKISLLKDYISDISIQEFIFYVPYEFKIGDESVRSESCVDIIYPGDRAKMLQKDSLKLFLFKSEYQLLETKILEIDSLLSKKFDEYIERQNGGMIGIEIVDKDKYQEHLKLVKNRLLPNYNRSYYGNFNENNEKILKIVFSKDGFHGHDIVEYNLLTNRIDRFYRTVTY